MKACTHTDKDERTMLNYFTEMPCHTLEWKIGFRKCCWVCGFFFFFRNNWTTKRSYVLTRSYSLGKLQVQRYWVTDNGSWKCIVLPSIKPPSSAFVRHLHNDCMCWHSVLCPTRCLEGYPTTDPPWSRLIDYNKWALATSFILIVDDTCSIYQLVKVFL